MLTAAQLSEALYDASVAGFELRAEGGGDEPMTYALCDSERVLASGETMEDALTEWMQRRDILKP